MDAQDLLDDLNRLTGESRGLVVVEDEDGEGPAAVDLFGDFRLRKKAVEGGKFGVWGQDSCDVEGQGIRGIEEEKREEEERRGYGVLHFLGLSNNKLIMVRLFAN